jgi:hypothetical protein
MTAASPLSRYRTVQRSLHAATFVEQVMGFAIAGLVTCTIPNDATIANAAAAPSVRAEAAKKSLSM